MLTPDSRMPGDGSSLVRVSTEKQRKQRDGQSSAHCHQRNGSEGKEALVLLLDLHGGLDSLTRERRGVSAQIAMHQ